MTLRLACSPRPAISFTFRSTLEPTTVRAHRRPPVLSLTLSSISALRSLSLSVLAHSCRTSDQSHVSGSVRSVRLGESPHDESGSLLRPLPSPPTAARGAPALNPAPGAINRTLITPARQTGGCHPPTGRSLPITSANSRPHKPRASATAPQRPTRVLLPDCLREERRQRATTSLPQSARDQSSYNTYCTVGFCRSASPATFRAEQCNRPGYLASSASSLAAQISS